MQVVVTCLIVAVVLFAAAFITRRRFGLLGLALATGSILSGIWSYEAGLIANVVGIATTPLSTAIILGVIVLLPSTLLMFHGSTYKSFIPRVVGAALFTLLALAFLIDPLGHVLTLQGYGADVYGWLVANKTVIIGGGLIIAVVDLFLTKPAESGHGKRRGH